MINIKKFLQIQTYILALFLFGFMFAGTSHASEELSDFEKLDLAKVKVSITNDQTGETTILDALTPKVMINSNDMGINSIKSNDESVVGGYDVFIPIEYPISPEITPFDDSGGTKKSGGVTARLFANYDLKKTSKSQEIRVNSIYGSWSPSSGMYSLSTRKVDAHSGAIHGKSLSKKPSSNSYTYDTGWGYNVYATGQAIPRAWSSAKVHISGMSATHTITLEITYP